MSETVFFLFIAVMLGVYLHGILGKENEEDEHLKESCKDCFSGVFEAEDKPENQQDIVVDAMEIVEDDALLTKVNELRKTLPNFDPMDFMEKAKKASEIICNAYIENDRDTLKNLLSSEVFDLFITNLENLQKKEHVVENLMFSVLSCKFYAIKDSKEKVSIAMRVISEQCNVIRDSKGNTVAGSDDHVVKHDEIWTFEHSTESNNNTWLVSNIRPYNA